MIKNDKVYKIISFILLLLILIGNVFIVSDKIKNRNTFSLFSELNVYDRLLMQYYGEDSFPKFLNYWNPVLTFEFSLDNKDNSNVEKEFETVLKDFLSRSLIICTDKIFNTPSALPQETLFMDFHKVGDPKFDIDDYLKVLNNCVIYNDERLKFKILKSKCEDSFFKTLINNKNEQQQSYKVNNNFLKKLKFLDGYLVLLPEEEKYYYFTITSIKMDNKLIITFSDFHLPEKIMSSDNGKFH